MSCREIIDAKRGVVNERTTQNYMHWEEQYLSILSDLLHGGEKKAGRNGMTRHRWCKQVRHDLRSGFPVLNSKRIYAKGCITELCWILQGRTDVKYLNDRNVKYWNLNYEQSGRTDGTLGPVYGHQLRSFNNGVDQLALLLQGIKKNPLSRRHLINLWNPEQLDEMALPPCWYAVQFNICGSHMDIMWNQRSADWFLGVPFDMVMMATFLELVAKGTGYTPRYVVGNFADTHLYEVHVDAANEQLSRVNEYSREYPSLSLEVGLIETNGQVFVPVEDNINISGYSPLPAIKAELV